MTAKLFLLSIVGLLAFTTIIDAAVRSNLNPENPNHHVGNESITSLTHEIVKEVKDVGNHVKSAASQATTTLNRKVRSIIESGVTPNLLQQAHEIASNFSELNVTEAGHKISRAVRALWSNDESGGDLSSIMVALNKINGQEFSSRSGNESLNETARYGEMPSSYSTTPAYTTAYTTTPKTVVISGPAGPQGIPGLPGLPGLPGAAADIGPLRVLVLARMNKLAGLVKKVIVLMCLKSAGLLALILALVIPLYSKLKKAGVVLPIEYAEPVAQTYGAAAPYPAAKDYEATTAIYNHIEQGYKKYGQ
jgi:hypothetical protein